MILLSLHAENFLRFRRIALDELPEAGVIGIRGPNEAGKTTLGEAIAFAAFGRTLRLAPEARRDAIRWGTQAASVRARLGLADGTVVRVRREFDRAGGYTAALERDVDGVVLAQGPRAVDAELGRRLGYDFEAFRYAFYLGQKEVDLLLASAGSGGALERMTGLTDLEAAKARAEAEAQRAADRGRELAMRAELTRELTLGPGQDPRRLAEAEAGRTAAEAALAEARVRVEAARAQSEAGASRAKAAEDVKELLERVKLAAFARSIGGRLAILEAHQVELGQRTEAARQAGDAALQLLHEYRMFSESLDELDELVKSTGRELAGRGVEVGTVPPGGSASAEPPKSDAQLLEARLDGQKRTLDAERVASGGLEQGIRLTRTFTWLTLLLAPVFVWKWQDPRSLVLVPAAAFGMLVVRALAERQRDSTRRIRESEKLIEDLEKDLVRLDLMGKACDRFSARDKQALLAGLEKIGSKALAKMATRIERRHPQFWKAPETFLEGYAKVLQEAVDQRRRAYEAALEAARKGAATLEALKGRFEAITRSPACPRITATPFTGLEPAGLRADLERDLDAAERLVVRLEQRGRRGESGGGREELAALFDRLDPQSTQKRPDLEGWFRVMRGAEPPGLSRGDDPLPWARKQDQACMGLTGLGEAEANRLAGALAEAERDLARRTLELELAQERVGVLAAVKAPPTEEPASLAEVRRELAAAEEEAAVRRTLADLLGATLARIRSRLHPAVAAFASRVLPRITGGRHGEVKINSQGDLLVFAPEAGEYVSVDHLSGGARDQLLLSLRLAFAGAVVASRAGPGTRQLLFLDEPLASSDEGRALAFLRVLSDRDECFRQVFVVTHRSPDEARFDMILTLDAGSDTVELKAEGARRARAR